MSIRAKLSNIKNILQYNRTVSFVLIALFLCSYKPLDVHKQQIKTVIIDAGHGGHDHGSMYGGVSEKVVTLQIAKKVGVELERLLPEVKIIYTRTDDHFVELWERAGVANRNNADLFISIHCNANSNTQVYGTETFSMGLHKSEGNLAVAKRENDVILLEKGFEQQYEGFDPNSPESHIYFSFLQSAYIDQSLTLAALVEDHFKGIKRNSRGVKQAGFLVLWKSKMPSILIETGFISNKSERLFLTSSEGQHQVALAIAKSVNDYKNQVEKAK
jgi:N-acetylmuramoyl-L-alanine amidase